MTERYDAIECEMGISTYASMDHAGFAGVSKARYSDFVVHEVDNHSTMAVLENTSPIQEKKEDDDEQSSKKRKLSETADTKEQTEVEEPKVVLLLSGDALWNDVKAKLSIWVGSEVTEQVISMLKHWEDTPNNKDNKDTNESTTKQAAKHIDLPAIKEKEIRRAVHEWIRSSLTCARGDTHDGKIRIWHQRFEKEMPNYGKFDSGPANAQKRKQPPRQAWPKDRPDYLKFVLYKENIDTGTAVKDITRRLTRGKSQKVRIGYAGMKDKRGITAQFCTLYQRQADEILWLNQPQSANDQRGNNFRGGGGGNTSKGGVSVIRVGNFEYVTDEMRLGTLKGNRCDVVLRNVMVSTTSETAVATTIANNGDKETANDTNEEDDVIDDDVAKKERTKACLEKAAGNLRQRGFINYFGMQRFGKYHDTHKVGVAVLQGDFETAVKIILSPKPDEMFRTANARKQWDERFNKLVEEKDSNLSTAESAAAKGKIESACAKQCLREMGRFMTCEIAILNSLVRKPLDYKRAFSNIPKPMRLMFLHAVQSYLWNHITSHRLDKLEARNQVLVGDLVLTDDKSADQGGSGTSGLGGKTVQLVTREDIAAGTYSMTDLVLPLVGNKIQYPSNECGALFDALLEKEGLTKTHFSKVQDRELALGGDYRKLICKPLDVTFEIKEYRDPLQPLLQTDLMKLNNIVPEQTTGPSESTTVNEAGIATNSLEDPADKEALLLGMTIGFTLPPSAYATIALRELMKRPTSSEYQRKLQLQGPCEGNIPQQTSN